jgi:pyrroline-5-carboxylate reductase
VGAAAISPGHAATDDDMTWAESLLGAVGTVTRLPEELLDAVTGLSGSGPAYVFLLAEAMTDAGVAAGLPREVSEALTIQTVLGAARLLVESGQSAADLRTAVTSPNGTTQAAIAVLEDRNVRAALEASVAAATERAHELGSA